jgi:hypothetical protein
MATTMEILEVRAQHEAHMRQLFNNSVLTALK